MKTWLQIFDASVRRGDDPCYAIYLADEYIKRKTVKQPGRGRPKKRPS